MCHWLSKLPKGALLVEMMLDLDHFPGKLIFVLDRQGMSCNEIGKRYSLFVDECFFVWKTRRKVKIYFFE